MLFTASYLRTAAMYKTGNGELLEFNIRTLQILSLFRKYLIVSWYTLNIRNLIGGRKKSNNLAVTNLTVCSDEHNYKNISYCILFITTFFGLSSGCRQVGDFQLHK